MRSFRLLLLLPWLASGCIDWDAVRSGDGGPLPGGDDAGELDAGADGGVSGDAGTPVCGDGQRTHDEGCDDGNLRGGDGCGSTCVVEPQFTCTGDAPSVCSGICGDTFKVGAEECDDGNTASGDGCSSTCVREFIPSHVALSYYKPQAADLTNVTAIDTSGLTVTLSVGTFPAGGFNVDANGRAVLSIGAWNVNRPVRISGSRQLVVVAAGTVQVSSLLDGAAKLRVPGPGGGAPSGSTPINPGTGTAGSSGGTGGSGGGGGGFGAAGGVGGTSGGTFGGGPGQPYAGMISELAAGSGGGQGGGPLCGSTSGNGGYGGAGGGAIQISSAKEITVSSAGGINVGGGGGNGGCSGQYGGGGGGSGGTIFLEAPAVTVAGFLTANGGGGGSGSSDVANGIPGADALLTSAVAQGGTQTNAGAGGPGGARFAATGAAGANNTAAGGGGGSVGRIWLRTRDAAATTTGATVSPSPGLSTTL